MTVDDCILLPVPRKMVKRSGVCRLAGRCSVETKGAGRETDRWLREEVAAAVSCVARRSDGGGAAAVSFRIAVAPELFRHSQAYRLRISPGAGEILASDDAGARYAVTTLRQICRQARGGCVPCVFIEDWPDFPVRGVMLDISRDRVPTMETLYSLVDSLSLMKVNQFQLYTEHTFAYPQHKEVWQNASPLTGEEVRALDDFCRRRGVELVPNQNSFGHMERWFAHERYRRLSEKPEGFSLRSHRFPFGSTLCPVDPASIAFLKGLYRELLPNFSSRLFNVGCDETWELGEGRSRAACEKRGKGRVYLDFLLKIHREVSRHGRTMQFWGDIVLRHPELIPCLPTDAIALVWGYEYDHPFEEQCEKFAACGLSFYVCPGTSTWLSLAGRTDNAWGNLRAAAQAGCASGAIGFLNTDWGDHGHWQPYAVSLLPYAFGAAVSWCSAANRQEDVVPGACLHLFCDPTGKMAQVACELGNVAKKVGGRTYNSSSLFHILFGADRDDLFDEGPLAEATAEQCREAEAEVQRLRALLKRARSARTDGPLLSAEFRQAGELLALAARIGALRLATKDRRWSSVPKRIRCRLRAEFRRLSARQKVLWLKRSRPGGLADSLSRLPRL